ncbi:alpha- and gamma-adaptin-binding protein p34-like [Uloborus diversus]|uniref:alpha- and gamma-adaptin-binding protein p34-like n=1 Tax=Uloborus diversus TaxID=327109 RepID=UPI00240A3A5F|nr:alpha- and gamma-adaptin-binding protein p34-like [Uloborus diversus]
MNAENAPSDTESKEDSNGATVSCGKNLTTEENVRKVKVGNDELSLEENWLNNVVSGDDPDGESFEALFSKFASMKERAEGLTGDSRKKYAEEVAIAFWKAMGGDEDEIEGLDD